MNRGNLRIDTLALCCDAWPHPHNEHREATDADLREMGYVKVTDEWLFCPGCGRPRVDGPNPGPYCLPTNCEMWEVVS